MTFAKSVADTLGNLPSAKFLRSKFTNAIF